MRLTIAEQVEALPLFHELDLDHGVVTAGVRRKDVLRGASGAYFEHGVARDWVLDIGCRDRHSSFEPKRRGALVESAA